MAVAAAIVTITTAVMTIADLLSVIAAAIALIVVALSVVVGVGQRCRRAEQRERERPDEDLMQWKTPLTAKAAVPALLVDLT
jgi:hypothetical protein